MWTAPVECCFFPSAHDETLRASAADVKSELWSLMRRRVPPLTESIQPGHTDGQQGQSFP